MKVAFATNDGTTVNEHFGRCARFDVYELSTDQAVLLAQRTVAAAGEGEDTDDRIAARVDLLRDCAILYVASIGGPAAARVVNARIHPLKVPEGTPIGGLNECLRTVLAGNPPPWLRKVLRERTPSSAPAWSPR